MQLITTQQLPALLRLTAAARAAFAERRRVTADRPAYQVVCISRGFYHLVETASERVVAFHCNHREACDHAALLERRAAKWVH